MWCSLGDTGSFCFCFCFYFSLWQCRWARVLTYGYCAECSKICFLPVKHASLLRIIVLMICGVFSIFPGTGRGTAAQTGDIKWEKSLWYLPDCAGWSTFLSIKLNFSQPHRIWLTRTCATSIGKTAWKGLSTGVAAVSSNTSSEKDICEAKEIGDVCKRDSTIRL